MKKILSLFAAIFMAVSMWGATYTKVTAAPADWSGDYLIVYEDPDVVTTAHVFTGVDAANGQECLSINGQSIVSLGVHVTVEAFNDGYSLKVVGGANDGKYMSSGSTAPTFANALKFNETAHKVNFAIDSNGNAIISLICDKDNTTDSIVTLRYNKASDQQRFRFYKSGQQPVQLYKEVIGGGDNGGEDGGDQGGEDGDDPTPAPASQPTSVNFDNLGYASWGKASSFSGDTYSEVSQTKNGVTFTNTKNTGSCYANSSAMRFYKDNDLTFAAPSGYTITSIVFTGSAFKNDVTTDEETCTSTTSALSWAGDASSVTFTRPDDASSYITLSAVEVTLAPVVKIGTTHYATFYHSSHAYVMPEGLEGITVEGVEGSALTLNKTHYAAGSVVPAGEALILHGAAGNYTLLAGSTANAKVAQNLLKGTSTADQFTTGGDKYYRLSVHEGVVGFYYGAADGAAFQPGANKAYLAISNTSAPAHFTFTDEVTAVENVEAVETVKFMENGQLFIKKNGVIYNAMGQVVK